MSSGKCTLKIFCPFSDGQDNSDYNFGKLHEYVSQKIHGDIQFKIQNVPLMKHSDLVQLNLYTPKRQLELVVLHKKA